jgi:hypothetical protein
VTAVNFGSCRSGKAVWSSRLLSRQLVPAICQRKNTGNKYFVKYNMAKASIVLNVLLTHTMFFDNGFCLNFGPMLAFVLLRFTYKLLCSITCSCNTPEGSTYDPSPNKCSCRYEIQLRDTKFQIFSHNRVVGNWGLFLPRSDPTPQHHTGRRSVFETEAVSNCFGSPLSKFSP